MPRITIKVNGGKHAVEATPDTPLLYILRNELRLHGPRFGIRSCVTPVASVQGHEVITLEGLGTPEKPHPLQTAFVNHQAAQCGYCTSAMIMGASSLMELGGIKATTGDAQIKTLMKPYLCRCGTHYRILAAIKDAAKATASTGGTA